LQHWSEQPCVGPVCAVHMTAGHNALRGSSPDQQHAFEDAVAHVGCPDRRIDSHCIKCCCPPNRYVTPGVRCNLVSITPRARRVRCIVRSWPSLPKPFWRVCWRARWQRPWWVSPGQQSSEPRPMPRAMYLGMADHGELTSREQAAQIAIALFAHTAKPVLAWHEPDPGREVASRAEALGSASGRYS
jgi:hypothetical protein